MVDKIGLVLNSAFVPWEAHKDRPVVKPLEEAKWQCLQAVFDVRLSVHLSHLKEVGDSVSVGVQEGLGVCHQRGVQI